MKTKLFVLFLEVIRTEASQGRDQQVLALNIKNRRSIKDRPQDLDQEVDLTKRSIKSLIKTVEDREALVHHQNLTSKSI